jgi:macrolide-specific efflux system membrane fusion protein
VTIPSAALGDRAADGSYTVQVVGADGTTTQPRQVRIGLNDKTIAEVRSGLSAGERVVTGGIEAQATPAPSGPPGSPPGS